MAFQDPVETAALRLTVMAALSDGERLSAHPADMRLLQRDAARISLAIQERFLLSERPGAGMQDATSSILLPAGT